MNVQDATREEFIRFFNTDVSGISCRYYFERWLRNKRFDDITDRLDEAYKEQEEAYKKYYEFMKKCINAKTLDERVEFCKKADHYDALAKKIEKDIARLEKKQNELLYK